MPTPPISRRLDRRALPATNIRSLFGAKITNVVMSEVSPTVVCAVHFDRNVSLPDDSSEIAALITLHSVQEDGSIQTANATTVLSTDPLILDVAFAVPPTMNEGQPFWLSMPAHGVVWGQEGGGVLGYGAGSANPRVTTDVAVQPAP